MFSTNLQNYYFVRILGINEMLRKKFINIFGRLKKNKFFEKINFLKNCFPKFHKNSSKTKQDITKNVSQLFAFLISLQF